MGNTEQNREFSVLSLLILFLPSLERREEKNRVVTVLLRRRRLAHFQHTILSLHYHHTSDGYERFNFQSQLHFFRSLRFTLNSFVFNSYIYSLAFSQLCLIYKIINIWFLVCHHLFILLSFF